MTNRRRKLILNGYTARRERKWNAPCNRDRYEPPFLLPLGHLVKGNKRRYRQSPRRARA